MNYNLTKKRAKELIEEKLSHFCGVSVKNANAEQFYDAVVMIIRDMLIAGRAEFSEKAEEKGAKKIYYLSMEFLMGRSLKNNLYNLNLDKVFTDALDDFGVDIDLIYDCEPDAGLGNGGLGRLAACYLDGLATQGYPARGYSILYECGIFKQKIVDGWQTELPDFWLPGGKVWLVEHPENAIEVHFDGHIEENWDNDFHYVKHVDYDCIKAVPYDLLTAGKDGKGVSMLRLWSAKATDGVDMKAIIDGDYLRAIERSAMAEVISKVLYPADNHPEGKSLRLKQQYFLVSASIQDIVKHHLHLYGTVENIPEKMAIQINDTHPTLVIPELMRILLDECGYGWDKAWEIVTGTVTYTNHTVMSEALECWREDLIATRLPRIYQIIKEIDNRYRAHIWNLTNDANLVERTAIISGGTVKMANLCVAACQKVNGVSALHSEILKNDLFKDYYRLTPDKFTNVTNGIAHRRWLCQANPELTSLITELIGSDFVYNAEKLEELKKYKDDASVLLKMEEIKLHNKQKLANHIADTTGTVLDPDSIFDVQVKRLHEYKRQHLNALHIFEKYLEIKSNPGGDYVPHTYIFGAKAAPGYYVAKKIISFICAMSQLINNDPDVNKYLKVFYFEDYNVTAAEMLMPAAEISEQISLAGTEASGTGNMKLMINGAVTLGTLDGANVEIHKQVGDDNIILFGMKTNEVSDLKAKGYNPKDFVLGNPKLKNVLDYVDKNGICGKPFGEITGTIVYHDPYMVLADYRDYCNAQDKAEKLWCDKAKWNQMSLMNVAGAGFFAADRSINDYARDIWHATPAFTPGVTKNSAKK